MQSFPRLLLFAVKSLFSYRDSQANLQSLAARQAALNSVMEAHRRGDYAEALDRAEGLRDDGDITPAYCFYRGSLLMQLGRADEAEIWLRRRVALPSDNKRMALGNSVLGHVLLGRGRFDAALACYETCLHLWPQRGSSYRNIAEAWLRRGDRPPEALKWAKMAVDKERLVQPDSDGSRLVHQLNLSEQLATLAWALAVNAGDAAEVARLVDEVDRLVDEAVHLAGTRSVESAALVHCHAGHAFAALGDSPKSLRYFDEAARIDTQGRWGREARSLSAAVCL